MTDVVAINILLEPDESTSDLALAVNARLRRLMPEGFALDSSHVPHVTVLQRYVRASALEQVLGTVGATVAAEDLAALELRATGVAHAEWDAPGIAIASLMLAREPMVVDLQTRLIAAVAPHAAPGGSAAAFVTGPGEPGVNETTIRYVERFVPYRCGPTYTAHLSVGMGRPGELEALEAEPFRPFDVHPRAIAVYQLGNNGRARRMLQAWPLGGAA